MQKKNLRLRLFLVLAVCPVLLLGCVLFSQGEARAFRKALTFSQPDQVVLTVTRFSGGQTQSLTDRVDQNALLSLLQTQLQPLRQKHQQLPEDAAHPAYAITLRSSDRHCTVYVSAQNPQRCYLDTGKTQYYLSGGSTVAAYLDRQTS